MVSKQESRIYYIEKGRLIFVENDLDNPNRIAVSVSSGTTIQVYDESLIGFMSDGKFYSWTLKGFSTKLAKNDAYYIYARLDRTGVDALVVFSINQYNLDGSRANAPEGEENPPSEQYYYVRIGEVTATDGTTNREVTYDSGMLGTTKDVYQNAGTAQLNEMFELNKTSDPWYIIVKHYFYDLTIKRSLKLIGSLIWDDKELQGVHTTEDIANQTTPDDEHLATSAYTQQFGDQRYLRKDQSDRTEHSLGIGKDLTVDGDVRIGKLLQTLDAVKSLLAGRGTIVEDDLIQTGRMEVRQSLTVLDLIINELQGIAADYLFSDVGKVVSVTQDSENTYVLYLDKKTDHDLTTLAEGDIIQQIVNSLPTGGTDYYSSWTRALSVNQAANSITVVMYADSEVAGGKNFPPVAGYNIARRGNAIVPDEGMNERSQVWMLSSREGRIQFLQNVYKPILEDYNYALTLGKLPDIKALKSLPVTTDMVGLVAQTIIAQNFYQFDYNGELVTNKVDRGEWSLDVAQSESPYRFITHEATGASGSVYSVLQQHTVWHWGCRWACLTDKTTQEPKWNATDWQMLEGYTELRMEFASSNGSTFAAGHVDTEVTPIVYYGNIDISSDIAQSDWGWVYELGTHEGRVLHITSEMMPANWSRKNKAVFTCTAYVRVGENLVQAVTNQVIV